jgi:protein-ribulosamine 3-kinase
MGLPVPLEIAKAIQTVIGESIEGFSFLSGGCINKGGRLTTSGGSFFLKWNDEKKFPGMFAAEARGLALLHHAKALAVPVVVQAGSADGFQFLLLEYIKSAARSGSFWKHFGAGLAALHKNSAAYYGLDHDNYIGTLPQRNETNSSWINFFIDQRLKAQLKIAVDQNRIEKEISKQFDVLFNKLSSLLPGESPALLHGDLWSGNLMVNSIGDPCLIDPAVYYGHREADLAMTQLFGGFDASFLHSYREVFPLADDFHDRFDLYNLYPLLVHLNLFGGGYKSQIVCVLKRFV